MTTPLPPSDGRLAGRVALVTGGTRGIGRAIATRLIEDGARVIVAARRPTSSDQGPGASEADFVQVDMSDADAPTRLAAALRERVDRLDILVNNAGDLGEPAGVVATSSAALDATLAIHLKAPWLTMNAVLPLMSAGGSIVNMASVAGHRVGASSAAYSVAKAALVHLTRCAAAELGALGIRVNSVSPGFVATGIHAQALDGGDPRADRLLEGLARLYRKRQALDRSGAPEDVAALVAFLASDDAAFVTGSDFPVDGGIMWGRAGLL